jgi:hypothetical protein
MTLRMTLMLGCAVAALASVSIVACGNGNSNENEGGASGSGGSKGSGAGGSTGTGTNGSGSSTGGTSGSGSSGTAGSGGSMGTGSGGTAGSADGGGVDCGKAATLHTEKPEGGLYCPFSEVGDGGIVYCSGKTPYCCAPKCPATGPCSVPPSSCEPDTVTGGATGTGCPTAGSYVYECEGPLDCANNKNGKVCCAAGTVNLVAPSCSVGQSYVSSNEVGTTCETTCAAGESIVCDTNTPTAGDPGCPSGMTCTPTKLHGSQIGMCQ